MNVAFTFESSGKIKLPSDAELAEMDKDNAILTYSSGTMKDGRPYYAYIAVKPSLYKEFRKRTAARETLILSDYGEVIAAGFSESPPPDVIRTMRDEYGCDPDYEAKLLEEALKQQDVFVKQKEDARINDIVAMLKKKKPAA